MGKTLKIVVDPKVALIKSVYYELDSPAAYAGVQKVYREAKRRDPSIHLKDVKDFLMREKTYTLYKPARKRFSRLQTKPNGLHTDWQCDLAIFDSIKRDNDGYPYLLVCIDVLSRKLFVAPAKSKGSEHMIQAFDKIFNDKRNGSIKPNKLYSDSGLEFQAKKMLNYFSKKDIIKNVMYSPHIHAGVVERANRTIKERLYRYFSEKKTQRWVDIIERIVGGINESVNRITGMSPNSVTFDNAEQLMQKLYKDNEVDVRSPKFNENDIVRISKEKGIFGKGYHPNYTNELFRIRAVKPTQPPHYKIEDLEGELIKGVFYEEELVLTKQQKQEDGDNNSQHRTAHILETRIDNKGIKEHLVKWEGLTDKHNSWVKDTDIVG